MSTNDKIPLSSLTDEPFVIMSRKEVPEGYDYIIKLCAKEGFSPKISFEVDRMETLFVLVESGMGISILPQCVSCFECDNHRMIKIEDQNITYDWVIAWGKEYTNPSLQIFLDEFRGQISRSEGLRLMTPGFRYKR
nr:LysR family substrate-binding domain-containing protein [Paenibacillus validus]